MHLDYTITQKHKNNPVRLMVLNLAAKKVHPTDITTVTRVQGAMIRRWCLDDGVPLADGVQPIGLRGLIDRNILTAEQYSQYRNLTRDEDLTSIMRLVPTPPREEDEGRLQEPERPSMDMLLADPVPGETMTVDEFSAASLGANIKEVSNAVQDGDLDTLKAQLSPKVFQYANGIFDGLNAMLGIIQSREWLEKQRAGELAALFSVVSDRGSQLLGSLSAPDADSQEQSDSRLPQRAAK